MQQQFTYIEEPRKEEISNVHGISTTYIIASNMNRKFQANKEDVKEDMKDQEEKTPQNILDEPELNDSEKGNTEASEEVESERPTTGIQLETLIDIDNEAEDV